MTNINNLSGDSAPQDTQDGKNALIVTDVPFWFGDTGAQQRMISLLRFLGNRGLHAHVFYLHPLTDSDSKAIAQLKLQVRPFAVPAADNSWFANIRRKISGISSEQESEIARRPFLTPDDFRWPNAPQQFTSFFEQIQPSLLIIEYVSLSCYVDYLTPVQRTTCRIVLDAHDVMHQRCERFRSAGKQNWLELDRDLESQLISKFDSVLAIQDDEANTFRQMAPDTSVMVAGHCPKFPEVVKSPTTSRPITVGFLGSNNQPNALGAQWLVDKVWPKVIIGCAGEVQLLLAGGFTETVSLEDLADSSIVLWPQLRDVAQFYEQVHIVVNSVKLGTGLKIKNVEALGWGKPLVTTTHSAMGLPDSIKSVIAIADDDQSFANQIIELVQDDQRRKEVSETVAGFARAEFNENSVYSEFATWLERHLD